MRPRSNAGFTLAELLVATLLSTLVMSGVYFAFNSSIRLWRNGEQDLQTYQDARTSMTIMTRELLQMLEAAGHLMEGEEDEIAFYAVAPSFHTDDGVAGERILWVRYRTRADAGQKGRTLVREERTVEGAMPMRPDEATDIDSSVIKHGRKRIYELASGVLDFELTYLWTGEEEADSLASDDAPPEIEIHELDEHREGDGIPQGIRIALTLADDAAPDGETTFTTYAIFQGPTDQYEEEELL